MKKIILLSLIFSLVLIATACVANPNTLPGPEPEDLEQKEIKALLTDKLDNVETVKVYHSSAGGYEEFTYEAPEHMNKIKDMYKSVKDTKVKYRKVRDTNEAPQSTPHFEILFYYNSGSFDRVSSAESGTLIYRFTTSSRYSWVTGENSKLTDIIDEDAVQYKHDYYEAKNSAAELLTEFRAYLINGDIEAAKSLTENVNIESIESLKRGNFEVTGVPIYHQDGSVTLIVYEIGEGPVKSLSFTIMKDDQKNWKIINILFDEYI